MPSHRRRVSRSLLLATAVVLIGLFTAPTAGAAAAQPIVSVPAPPAHPASTVAWTDCGDGFQCATAAVPLDYHRPHGTTISLALIRLPAADPAHRIGSLFVNPGGPGDSGVSFVRDEALTTFLPSVRARFDIVGFDPRGVGASSPLHCFASGDQEDAVFADVPIFPTTHAEVVATVRANATLSRACARRTPELAAHLGTGDVARDLDRLRQAVGDNQITFVGYSYGTYLAAVYANMFPRRVRAIVADGVINPDAWVGQGRSGRTVPVDVRLQSDTGTSAALHAFLTACDQHPADCPFAPGPGATSTGKFDALMSKLRGAEIDVADLGPVSYADAIGHVVHELYKFANWPELAGYLQHLATASAPTPAPQTAARETKPTLRDTAADLGTTAPADYDNSLDIAEAVTCEDSNNPTDPAVWVRDARQRDKAAPYFGAYWTWLDEACASWTVRAADRYTGPFTIRPAHPLLVVGVLRDPATRYADAVSLAQLSPGARLLTVDGTGHTSRNTGSRCAQEVTATYLLSGRLPHVGAECKVTQTPFS